MREYIKYHHIPIPYPPISENINTHFIHAIVFFKCYLPNIGWNMLTQVG